MTQAAGQDIDNQLKARHNGAIYAKAVEIPHKDSERVSRRGDGTSIVPMTR
jgi:hypothetical protein